MPRITHIAAQQFGVKLNLRLRGMPVGGAEVCPVNERGS